VGQPTYYKFLAVEDWHSDYSSVNNLLLHLIRKTKSERSKKNYLWHLFKFCQYVGKKPNELITLRRDRAENLVQKYADNLMPASPRYSNLATAILKAFFFVNGFKRARALELETYHAPKRFRIRPEYIPTKSEIYGMADSAGSLRDRAIILTMYSTGLRNSTIRAILFRDVAEELNKGIANIMIPVYEKMKEIDPSACKGGIPYYTFMCDEATLALRLYLKEREDEFGGIEGSEPLFCSEYNQIPKIERKGKILTARQVQMIVKSTARKSGQSQWELVHPHCLRKSFETVLHSPLIDGSNMDVKVQEFFMGHILPRSQDTYFDSSKVEKMRLLYSKLKFGRTTVENKFKLLKAAVARAFEDTDIDPDQVMEEYVKLKYTRSNAFRTRK
jgi:integrase